jgi:hypothetical protein
MEDFFLSFFFFWQYWSLNSGPHACYSGPLPLEPLHQPFFVYFWDRLSVDYLPRTIILLISASWVARITAGGFWSDFEKWGKLNESTSEEDKSWRSYRSCYFILWLLFMDLIKSRSLVFLSPSLLDTLALFSFCLYTIHSLHLTKLKKPENKVWCKG